MSNESFSEKLGLVSVIIPCYNAEDFIVETLESVFAQTYRNFEIIIVDDGSTDNSKNIISNYPDVTYIYQANQGVCTARNKGLNECNGKYIVFLDSDDKLTPDRLEIGIEYMDSHGDCAFVLGWWDTIDSDGKVYDKNKSYLEKLNYNIMLEGKALVSTSGGFHRKECLLAVGGFGENIPQAQDYNLYLKLLRKYSAFFHNQTVFYYRKHSNNTSTNSGGVKTLRSLLKTLNSQVAMLKNQNEVDSCMIGKRHWINLFGPQIVGELVVNVKRKKFMSAIEILLYLVKIFPFGTVKHLFIRIIKNIKFS